MSLSGISFATLSWRPRRTRSFTVSGWTGKAVLTGGGSAGTGGSTGGIGSKGPSGTVVAVKDGSFTLSNTRLTSTDGMQVQLRGITTADLTDTSAGGNTVSIAGWTGAASLVGPGDTLVDTVIGDTTLTNTSLAVSGLPKVTLSGFTAANLTDSDTGGITFTVSGWTGSGSLDQMPIPAVFVRCGRLRRRAAGYTLSDNFSLTSDRWNVSYG